MKKLSQIETEFTQFINDHIKLIQYSCYAIGLAGVATILRSTRSFSRFSYPGEIPKEFISKGVTLQGKVVSTQTFPALSSVPPTDGEPLHTVRLQIEHIPVLKFKWMSRPTHPLLLVELAGIWCTAKGTQTLQQLILNKEVWFTLYGIHQDQNVLYSSVLLKRSWKLWLQRDVGINLLRDHQGWVAAWRNDFNFNEQYAHYFRRLLHYEAKSKDKKFRLF